MAGEALKRPAEKPAATYERLIGASDKRVWENVLDWEHLPFLHRTSFQSIRCESAGPWGWRVAVGIEGLHGPRDTRIELLLDRAEDHYVTRTLEGPGEGNEIWTTVTPETERETHIRVEFHLPGVARRDRETVGKGFVHLYTRLWDEDEGMMRERQRVLDAGMTTPPRGERAPVALGEAAALRAALPRRVEAHGREYRVLEVAGELRAHPTVCPHLGGPLGEAPLEGGAVVCPWHGYGFHLATGHEREGRRCLLADRPSVELDAAGQARLVFEPSTS